MVCFIHSGSSVTLPEVTPIQLSSDSHHKCSTTATAVTEHATAVTEHATAVMEHATAVTEHATAVTEDATAVTEHASAVTEHATAVTEHATAVTEHATAVTEDATAVTEHASAVTEHATAVTEHATAVTEHTAPKDEASSSSTLAGIETLTIDNTQKIFEIMYDARKKWRSIGGIFNVSESTLDNIDAENKHNDDKLRSVIIEWLKMLGEPCTWSQVAMALRNKTVAREDLALQVFKKYPGMLSYKKIIMSTL